MTKELLIKYLNNQCSGAELKEVLLWIKTEASTRKSKDLVAEDWDGFSEDKKLKDDEKFTALFDKIQERIDLNSQQKKGTNKTFTLSVLASWLTKAAAILLIPILGFLLYTLDEIKVESSKYAKMAVDSLEVIAPIGSRTVVQLTDGSVVNLNYGSTLKYPKFFTGDTREVLLEGEGYFEVTHNPEMPFIVKTNKLNIKALGTTFNVLAYLDDDRVETTLVEGKVVLEQNLLNGTTKALGFMEPGQHVKYNTITNEIRSPKGDIENYISWKDGKVVFEDTPIVEVAEKLNRMFNTNISVEGKMEDFVYTVTFIDEPLFQILDLMAIATPISYKAFPRKKLADGTYSKQKIVIKRR